jgi:hypothetical protein
MTSTPSKSRLVDKWVSGFDLNKRRKFTLQDENGNTIGDVYFKPVTRSDRLRVQDAAQSDEALKLSTIMFCQMAELEDGSKAFSLADVPKLQRELPETELNRAELFLFDASDLVPTDEVKND